MSHLRTITTTGADVVRDVPRLFPPEIEYENEEPTAACLKLPGCKPGWGEHDYDCPYFEDNSHAGGEDVII